MAKKQCIERARESGLKQNGGRKPPLAVQKLGATATRANNEIGGENGGLYYKVMAVLTARLSVL